MYPQELEPSKEVKVFLDVKKELGVETTDEVQEIIASANKLKIETNRRYAYLTYLKSKAGELEKIKSISLETEKGFIKSVSISKKMIDEARSTETEYCVRIPYSDYFLYVPRNQIAWVSYDNRGILYLVDDKEYVLYDQYNNEVSKVNGEDVESVSKNEKQKINEYYKKY